MKFDIRNSGKTEYVIDYQPGEVATRFHMSPARVKVAWGPVRSGKSTAMVWRFFFKAKDAAANGVGLRGLLLRDTFRNLQDTTAKTLQEWLGPLGTFVNKSGVQDFVMELDGQRHELLLRHGQTAQDASSFLSSEYGFIGLEEACPAFTPSGLISPGISEEVFDIGLTRLVQRGIDNPELVITCNPPTPLHWVNKRIVALSEEKLHELGWWSFFFPAAENEQNLRPGYYDELRRSLAGKDHLLRRFVEGEIVAIYPGMPVFSADFKQSLHVVNTLKPVKDKEIMLGFDAGLTPSAVWFQLDMFGRVLVLNELQAGYVDDRLSEQMGAKRFAELMKQESATRFPGYKVGLVYADPAVSQKQQTDEKTVKQILESEGFTVVAGRVDLPSRIEAIRGRLTTLVDGDPAMLLSRSGCPLLIEALSGGYRYGVSNDATRVHGSEPLKDMYSHVVDALGYAMSILCPPQYQNILGEPPAPRVENNWSPFDYTIGERT
jgi:hypothetical protein